MSASTRALLCDSVEYPSKPTDHGCGYFDPGCPWNICYACEYERDPIGYEEQFRKLTNMILIAGYFKNTNAAAVANQYSAAIQDAILAYLDTPIADRPAALPADVKKALDAVASS
jgi:hypothetical protein